MRRDHDGFPPKRLVTRGIDHLPRASASGSQVQAQWRILLWRSSSPGGLELSRHVPPCECAQFLGKIACGRQKTRGASMRRLIGAQWLGMLLVFGVGCDSTNTGSCSGRERCACYPNKTCDDGLECRSGLCVQGADSTPVGNAGTNNATSSTPERIGATANAGAQSTSPESNGAQGGAFVTPSGTESGGVGLTGSVSIPANGGQSVATGGVPNTSGGGIARGGASGASGQTSSLPPSLCGNATLNAGEVCDQGASNGLIYGAASDCSKTCGPLPVCRTADATQACTAACGDGHHDAAEACDDGNRADGDGCSSVCQIETGFSCIDQKRSASIPCPSNPNLNCLVLGATHRDFQSGAQVGGHPDFLFAGAVGPGGTEMTCVPNANGDIPTTTGSYCSEDGDGVELCTGLVQDSLGSDGKPHVNLARAAGLDCQCRYTDWNNTGILLGTAEYCYDADDNLYDRIGYSSPLSVRMIKDEVSFAQWYNPSDFSQPLNGTLELASSGTNQFTFNASTPGAAAGAAHRTIADDLHAIFMGTETTLKSGFFPVENLTGEKICNIWPYWLAELQTNCGAGSAYAVPNQWDARGSYEPRTAGTGGPVAPVKGVLRNYHFTTEIRYLYRFTGEAASLSITSTDDTWVFVNGKLVVDYGGTHTALTATVPLNSASLGLVVGNLYEIAIFRACRSPRDSDFVLTLPDSVDTRSVCSPN